jgi:hypothetical protein
MNLREFLDAADAKAKQTETMDKFKAKRNAEKERIQKEIDFNRERRLGDHDRMKAKRVV